MKKAFFILAIVFFIPSLTFAGEIKLMFPKGGYIVTKTEGTPGKSAYYTVGPVVKDDSKGVLEYIETDLKKFIKMFQRDDYKVDQIELWISGKAEPKGVTQFFLSIAGEGGCKIILKPQQ